jgi:outer membrane protein OmpA-like peptidoglycan-associated protein
MHHLRVREETQPGGIAMKPIYASALAIIACGVFAGCSVPEPKQADVAPELLWHTDFPPDIGHYASRVESQTTATLVPTETQRVCSGSDPRFAFDSSRLTKLDARTVQGLSACMKYGPLAGWNVLLVGRADSRGPIDYNERLGLERAQAVKLALMKTGIPGQRISVASLGKDDAVVPPRGSDRRVDVQAFL